MFEVGFSEIVLILGLALLVLGPEKLPGLAQKVGRWTGRARAMARQLRAQLEQEVTVEELARSRPMQPSTPPPEPTPSAHHPGAQEPPFQPVNSDSSPDPGSAPSHSDSEPAPYSDASGAEDRVSVTTSGTDAPTSKHVQ